MRTEIREARQEHGRLASGVAEISGQVRVISDRKDQIKKKIRKLTKTLSKKDHHRKVKSGLRTLQQDHERILQAMTKAKLLNKVASKRNNRTNHHNHTNSHQGSNSNKNKSDEHNDEDNDGISSTSTDPIPHKREREGKGRKRNKADKIDKDETANAGDRPQDNSPVVLPIEDAKNKRKDGKVSGANVILPLPTSATTTTTTGPSTTTTTTPTTTTPTTTTTTEATTPKPTNPPLPVNCYEVLQYGNWTSGVYTIQPGDLAEPIQVSKVP